MENAGFYYSSWGDIHGHSDLLVRMKSFSSELSVADVVEAKGP